MFPLFVTEQLVPWPEKETHERTWMNVREARKLHRKGWVKEAMELSIHVAWKETKQGRLQKKARKTGLLGAHLQGKRAFEKPSSGNELKIAWMDLKSNDVDNETKGDKVSGDSGALTSLVRI